MKLYKLINPKCTGYDVFDSAIVCAESANEAKTFHPFSLNGAKTSADYFKYDDEFWKNPSWCKLEEVIVEEIGEANSFIQKGIVLASFNAE